MSAGPSRESKRTCGVENTAVGSVTIEIAREQELDATADRASPRQPHDRERRAPQLPLQLRDVGTERAPRRAVDALHLVVVAAQAEVVGLGEQHRGTGTRALERVELLGDRPHRGAIEQRAARGGGHADEPDVARAHVSGC